METTVGLFWVCLFTCCCMSTSTIARINHDIPSILLRSAKIEIPTTPQRHEMHGRRRLGLAVKNQHAQWGHLSGKEQLLVVLKPQTTAVESQKLLHEVELSGGLLTGYLPESTYILLGDGSVEQIARQSAHVLWVGDYAPEYKLSPSLKALSQAVKTDGGSLLFNTTSADSKRSGNEMRLLEGIQVDSHNGSIRIGVLVHFPDLVLRPAAPSSPPSPPASVKMSTAAVSDWLPQLRSRFGVGVDMQGAGPLAVMVLVPIQHLEAVVIWLCEQPLSHWISAAPRFFVRDFASGPIVQSGNVASYQDYANEQFWPIWAAGITGTGQIIGTGDSGLAHDHAFFIDPAFDLANRQLWTDEAVTSDGVFAMFDSTEHRKLRRYVAVGGPYDSNGHGTHTAGTLAGSTLPDTADPACTAQSGLAKDAKLSVVNMGAGGGSGIVRTLSNLQEFYSLAYDVGGRVHSDSWGSAQLDYDGFSYAVDAFTWRNKDFVPIFAAGNYGENQDRNSGQQGTGTRTVTSPANSKNCIAVGATPTQGEASGRMPSSYPVYDATVASTTRSQTFKVLGAEFGSGLSVSNFGRPLPLGRSSPSQACEPLVGGAAGRVVLIQRGVCNFLDKALAAQEAGALAAIIFDDALGGYFQLFGDPQRRSEVLIPVMSIPRHIGVNLVGRMNEGELMNITFSAGSTPEYDFDNLAAYSSQGPTLDGRVKPDIITPGTTVSATPLSMTSQAGDCPLGRLAGTSMAAPLVAGAAALVRQYFMDGFYPNATREQGVPFEPTGYLVKAVLLGGAVGIQGVEVDTGLPVDPPPSYRQGYGRLQLDTAIPLMEYGTLRDWNLQLVDGATLSESGEQHSYCITAAGGPLKVTLVWYDYPAAMVAQKALVNDLDLSVQTATGAVLLGNGGGVISGRDFDRENPVEQVIIQDAPAGDVQITVVSHAVFSPAGGQPYALVVHGRFSGVLDSEFNPGVPEGEVGMLGCQVNTATAGLLPMAG